MAPAIVPTWLVEVFFIGVADDCKDEDAHVETVEELIVVSLDGSEMFQNEHHKHSSQTFAELRCVIPKDWQHASKVQARSPKKLRAYWFSVFVAIRRDSVHVVWIDTEHIESQSVH
jgi:hypothetical protein